MNLSRLLWSAALAALSGLPVHAAPAVPADESLPEGALVRLGTSQLRHDGSVYAVAYAPDGKTLAAAGADRFLTLWDPATGKRVRRITVEGANGFRTVAYSADGKLLAAGDMTGTIRLFDPATGESKRQLPGQRGLYVTGLGFSPDGKYLASTDSSGACKIWTVDGGAVKHTLAAQGPRGMTVSPVAFLPDGKTFLVRRSNEGVHQFDVETGKETQWFKLPDVPAPAPGAPPPPAGVLTSWGLSPDGKTVVLCGGDRGVHLYDAVTAKYGRKLDLPLTIYPYTLTFTANSRFLVLAGGNRASVIGIASGKEVRTLEDSTLRSANVAACSPDGGSVVLAGSDPQIRLWNLAEGRERFPPSGHSLGVVGMTFLSDGNRLVSAGQDGRLFCWDVETGKPLVEHREAYLGQMNLLLAPDGETVRYLASDRSIRAWQPTRKREVTRQDVSWRGSGSYFAVSPDGSAALMADYQAKVEIMDVKSGKIKQTIQLSQPNQPVYLNVPPQFSPDGRWVLTTTNDQRTGANLLHVWDANTGRQLWASAPTQRGQISRVSLSMDGRSLVCQDSQAVKVLEMASGLARFQVPGGTSGMTSLAATRDGERVAWAGSDNTIRLYSAASGKELAKYDSPARLLAFSLDGKRLASADPSGLITVWKVPAEDHKLGGVEFKDALWRELGNEDPKAGYQAILKLASDPAKAVPFLKERLKPPPGQDPKAVAKLIADLDSDAFEVREKAQEALTEAGTPVEDALRKTLMGEPSAEVRRRIEEILDKLKKEGLNPDRLRLLRSLEALERMGTADARAVVEGLTKEAPDHLKFDIESTLQRMPKK